MAALPLLVAILDDLISVSCEVTSRGSDIDVTSTGNDLTGNGNEVIQDGNRKQKGRHFSSALRNRNWKPPLVFWMTSIKTSYRHLPHHDLITRFTENPNFTLKYVLITSDSFFWFLGSIWSFASPRHYPSDLSELPTCYYGEVYQSARVNTMSHGKLLSMRHGFGFSKHLLYFFLGFYVFIF